MEQAKKLKQKKLSIMKKLSSFIILIIALSSCKKNNEIIPQANNTSTSSNAVPQCPNTYICTISDAAMVQRDSSFSGGLLYTNTNYANYPVFKAETWFAPLHVFESRSLIKFNLPPNFFSGFTFCQADLVLKENVDINSITNFGILNPYLVSQPNNANAANIVRIRNNWNQNNVTWNTQPGVSNSNVTTVPSITTGPSYIAGSDHPTINITQIMQSVQRRGTDRGLEIKMPANSLLNAARQFGSNQVSAALQAQLVFYY